MLIVWKARHATMAISGLSREYFIVKALATKLLRLEIPAVNSVSSHEFKSLNGPYMLDRPAILRFNGLLVLVAQSNKPLSSGKHSSFVTNP